MRIKLHLSHVLAALTLVACAEDSDDMALQPDAASDGTSAAEDDTTDTATSDDETTDTSSSDDEQPTTDEGETSDDDVMDDESEDDSSTDEAELDAGDEPSPTETDPNPDAGSNLDLDAGPGAPTLCEKYGGADVVESVVKNQVLGAIAEDCRINVFFTMLTSDGLTRVADCLSIQVQELFGCDGVVYAGSESSNGLACRSMADAHLGLGISSGDFNALIEDVVAGLTAAGVEAADIEAAAPALLGMHDDIVEEEDETSTRMMCTMPDAGMEQDAGNMADVDASPAMPANDSGPALDGAIGDAP